MYSKLRSTMAGLFAATAMLAAAALIGQPVAASAEPAALPAGQDMSATPMIEAEAAEQRTQARPRKRALPRVYLATPYFSFAELLPRRGES